MQKSAPKKVKRATTEDNNNAETRAQGFLNEVQAILNEQILNDLERVNRVCSLVEKWIQNSRLLTHPFIISELTPEKMDVVENDAEKIWRAEQLSNLTLEKETIEAELASLIKQNEAIAATSPIHIRNIALINILNTDLTDLSLKITKHQQAQIR